MNPITAITIISGFIALVLFWAMAEEITKQRKREKKPVKFNPSISKTVHPDKQLDFNKWMKYVRKENDKIRKSNL